LKWKLKKNTFAVDGFGGKNIGKNVVDGKNISTKCQRP
jgi:hypothetical protein